MRYHDLSITDFRSIKSLRFEDFKRINVITGKNNSGKTSVLEALFLLSGMSNPMLPVVVNNFRGLVLANDEDFSFLFHNLDFSLEPEINGLLGTSRRVQHIKPRAGKGQVAAALENQKVGAGASGGVLVSSNGRVPIEGITLEFKESEDGAPRVLEFSMKDLKSQFDSAYKETLRCSFFNSSLAINALGVNFESIVVNKEVPALVEILKEVEPRIADLRMGAGGMIYADIGIPKMIPLNLMGDGLIRILSMTAVASTMKGGVLLIDEIENGLHHSALQVLWKALLLISEQHDVQVFATTHSWECIASLASLLDAERMMDDEVRLFRIDRKAETHRVFSYSSELMRTGIEEKVEVR